MDQFWNIRKERININAREFANARFSADRSGSLLSKARKKKESFPSERYNRLVILTLREAA